jgi:hypothetical protein
LRWSQKSWGGSNKVVVVVKKKVGVVAPESFDCPRKVVMVPVKLPHL